MIRTTRAAAALGLALAAAPAAAQPAAAHGLGRATINLHVSNRFGMPLTVQMRDNRCFNPLRDTSVAHNSNQNLILMVSDPTCSAARIVLFVDEPVMAFSVVDLVRNDIRNVLSVRTVGHKMQVEATAVAMEGQPGDISVVLR